MRLTNKRIAARILHRRITEAMQAPITTTELQGVTGEDIAYTERTRIGVAQHATKMLAPVMVRLCRLSVDGDCDPVTLAGE